MTTFLMCDSRKYPFPPLGCMVIGNSKGVGVGGLKSQKCLGKVWSFSGISGRVGGSNPKIIHGGGMELFWNNTIYI